MKLHGNTLLLTVRTCEDRQEKLQGEEAGKMSWRNYVCGGLAVRRTETVRRPEVPAMGREIPGTNPLRRPRS